MKPFAVFLVFSSALLAQTYTISTFAGGGPPNNVSATAVGLAATGVAVDAAGNAYISSLTSVFLLDHASGTVSRVVGTGIGGVNGDNGPATSARLLGPSGLAVDSAGNLYIADQFMVRKVSNGVITTVAGSLTRGFGGDNGPATSAQLDGVAGVAVDSAGNLYIADVNNNRIREVSNGVITTVVGNGTAGFGGDNGPAISAELNHPSGVAVDSAGNLYIADQNNFRVREVSSGVITTVAGNGGVGSTGDNGPATAASMWPNSVALDSAGNLYIGDNHDAVRRVSKGVITTVAGNGTSGFSGDNGPATSAQLTQPAGVVVDSAGNLYIADGNNRRIRKVSIGVITTVAGNGRLDDGDNGPATSAQLAGPNGVALGTGGSLYVSDFRSATVRKVSGGVITTVAGNGTPGFNGDNGPAINAQLEIPLGIAVDSAGNLYIADENHIREVSNGVITTIAGTGLQPGFSGDNGPATNAQLSSPSGVAVDSVGTLYIADTGNNRIRKVSNGVITTVAGNGIKGFSGDGGLAAAAALSTPRGVAVDFAGNLFFTDSGNQIIRKVSNGVITTVAELPNAAGIAVDTAGNLFVTDQSLVYKVSNGIATTVAGNGTHGFSGDNGPATSAELGSPFGVALDAAGRVYVADPQDLRVRLLTPVGGPLMITTPTSLPPGTIRMPYGPVEFSATGGTGVYTNWSATAGTLPSGLILTASGSGAVLSGTVTQSGGFSPMFAVTDSSGAMAHVTLQLSIIPPPPPVIISVSPNPVQGTNANQTLFINGSGFQNGLGLKVRLTWASGQVDLQGPQLNYFNSNQLSVSFNFSVAPGNWTAQVFNPDFQGSSILFFSVTAPGSGMTTSLALPQFIFGGAWYSSIYLSNTTNLPATAQVTFSDDNASPLNVPFVGIGFGVSQTVNLSSGGTVELQTLSGGNQSIEGSAELSLPPGVIGYAVFRQVVPGRADQEALVPFSSESSQIADFTFDDTSVTTSVAFLNPSSQSVTVTATAYGPDGTQVGSTQIVLAPHFKSSNELKLFAGMAGIAGQQGRVVVSVPNGAVSVLALRFDGSAFTDIPVNYR